MKMITVFVVITATLFSAAIGRAQTVNKIEDFPPPEITKIILLDKEVSSFSISKPYKHTWPKGISGDGNPIEEEAVKQYISTSNDKPVGLLLYCIFKDSNEALNAAKCYSEDMAAKFKKGIWKDKKPIGNACWIGVNRGSSLIVQKDRYCFYVSLDANDSKEDSHDIALFFAKKIVSKIENAIKTGSNGSQDNSGNGGEDRDTNGDRKHKEQESLLPEQLEKEKELQKPEGQSTEQSAVKPTSEEPVTANESTTQRQQAQNETNWLVLCLTVVGLVIAGFVVVSLLRRRKHKTA